MKRRFLTTRRTLAILWDILPSVVLLLVHFALSNTYPILSKLYAIFAFIFIFVSGLKIGFLYHRFLIGDSHITTTKHHSATT